MFLSMFSEANIFRVDLTLVLSVLIASFLYLCFLVSARCYTKNDHHGSRIDWSTWVARAASVLSMTLVIVLVILQDKNVNVFLWPPNNFLIVTGLYTTVPINWMILDTTIRFNYQLFLSQISTESPKLFQRKDDETFQENVSKKTQSTHCSNYLIK